MKLIKTCKIIGGNPAPKEGCSSSAEALPFVKMKDLGRAHLTNNLTDIETKIDPIFAKKKRLKIIKKGSVLLPRSGSVALNHRAILGQDSYMVSHICALEVIHPDLNNTYLYYFLRAKRFDNITKKTTGLDAITFEDLGNIDIHFPEIGKQKQIIQILDTADALRQKRKEQLNLLDDYLKSVFFEIFGDPVRNEKRCKFIKLEEIIINGPQNGLYKPSSFYGSGVPILRIDCFYDGVVTDMTKLKRLAVTDEELRSFQISEDDIVINRVNSRSHLGKCALIPYLNEQTVFESNMMRLAVDKSKILPLFLSKFLTTPFVKNQILNSAKDAVNQSSINHDDVKNFKVFLPSINLQNKFASIVEQVEQTKQKMSASLDEMDNHFNALMQRYFG